jgi:hypothetical protein
VPLLQHAAGGREVLAELGAADVVRQAGGAAEVLEAGASLELGPFVVEVVGGQHAVIHPDVPRIGNVGLLVRAGGTTLFHPGDSYATAPDGVDVLAFPLNAPWAGWRRRSTSSAPWPRGSPSRSTTRCSGRSTARSTSGTSGAWAAARSTTR